MSGLNTGRCGHSGCENPCPRDEDFCCSGCEEAAVREDEARDAAEFISVHVMGSMAPQPPSLRERIEALPRYACIDFNAHRMDQSVRLGDVLALLDPECSLCEQGHVPAQPCAEPPLTVEQMRRETSTYPRTEWNEDAGVWVEWESEGIGKVVGPPDDDDAVERRVEPGF